MIGNSVHVLVRKSKGLSNGSIKAPAISDNSLAPSLTLFLTVSFVPLFPTGES